LQRCTFGRFFAPLRYALTHFRQFGAARCHESASGGCLRPLSSCGRQSVMAYTTGLSLDMCDPSTVE
jgi:hypothetical protein